MIYANNAGTSWPKPEAVLEAVSATLRADPRQAGERFDAARREVALFLGAPDPERLLFTPGCTAALALALGDLAWEAGDAVITSALEHHALARPVEQLSKRRGVRHLVAPYRPGAPVDLDFVRDALRSGRVRLIATTAASNVTGELLPVAELGQLAHEYGALLLIDAAQTAGVLPLDVHELGADLLTFAGHKGPLGPQGIGGLWAGPDVAFEAPLATCEIDAKPGSCSSFPGYCDVGSVNLAAAAGLAAGVRWLNERGLDATAAHARRLGVLLAEGLEAIPGCAVYGGANAARTATVSVLVQHLPLQRAESFFRERGIVVRAGQHCAPLALRAIGAPEGTLRISFGPQNTASEVEEILAAVRDAVARGVLAADGA